MEWQLPHTLAFDVDLIAGLGMMIPIIALLIPIVAIWTAHQRKMLEMRIQLQQGTQKTNSADTKNLQQEFYTLRESLTAHAMSVDENIKALASRMTAVENRLAAAQQTQDVSGGRG